MIGSCISRIEPVRTLPESTIAEQTTTPPTAASTDETTDR